MTLSLICVPSPPKKDHGPHGVQEEGVLLPEVLGGRGVPHFAPFSPNFLCFPPIFTCPPPQPPPMHSPLYTQTYPHCSPVRPPAPSPYITSSLYNPTRAISLYNPYISQCLPI